MISESGRLTLTKFEKKKLQKTYSTRDSLVVTDPTTSLAVSGLSMGEQTGSRVLHYLWPYVIVPQRTTAHIGQSWHLPQALIFVDARTTSTFIARYCYKDVPGVVAQISSLQSKEEGQSDHNRTALLKLQ